MKTRICFVFLMMVLLGCESTHQAKSTILTGEVSQSTLLQSDPKYKKAYQNYSPSTSELASMKQLEGKELVVLFGSWCHDSDREIPKLLKLLDASNVALKSIRFEAVSTAKTSTNGLHQTYNLQYTPTIILLDEGVELGRVVERPINSIAEDLAALVK